MKAENVPTKPTSLAGAPTAFRWGFAAGMEDIRSGLPYRSQYEMAKKVWQLAYEQGRLCGGNLLAAGMPVPFWYGDRKEGDAVEALMRQAAIAVGPAIPRRGL